MESGLEVVGRHAMLFDDDAALSFTNSKDALIEWNSLFIDRFDVRNLLTNPPPSFRNLPSHYRSSLPDDDQQLRLDLDRERFADLPSSPQPSPNRQSDFETEGQLKDGGGYHFVPFSYGNSSDSSDQKNSDPPTEKVHQIVARTALFVGEHGGQSEIVLRVKQGDNPTFGFLMPQHQLHPYFRYLVDHPDVLKAEKNMESREKKANDSHAGGALSLLGSVYGSGEDEDFGAEVDGEPQQTFSSGASSAAELSRSSQAEQAITSANYLKDETDSIAPQALKMKVPAMSKPPFNGIKPSGLKKEGNVQSSTGSIERSTASSLFPLPKAERSVVDPPSLMKRLVDRIVEIIMKNGKDFEAVLIQQDRKAGKFPFLLPSNENHPYYLKVLKKAQESRISVKSFSSGKDGSQCHEVNKEMVHSLSKNEIGASEFGSDDLPFDDDKKEKFKMVIGKSKKDLQDQASKEHQQPSGFTVDTAAAAAILQAATRGMRKPNMSIFSRTPHASSCEGGPASGSEAQQQNLNLKETGKSIDANPVDKDNGENALLATASGAGSSETSLTREQKLKAERLRRAKMFAAMIKSGAAPLGAEPEHALSVEPCGSEKSGLAAEADNEELTKTKSLKNLSDDENEQKVRLHRHYRSRKHDDSDGDEEKKEDYEEVDKHSKRRHRSFHSSRQRRDRSKDKHRHQSRHSASKSKESQRRHKGESSSSLEDDGDGHRSHKHDNISSEEEHKQIKRRHRHDSYENEHKRRKQRHRHDSSSEDEQKRRKQRHRHDSSSEDEHKRHKRSHKDSHKEEKRKGRSKNEGTSNAQDAELEEGEIGTKSSDQSISAICDDASREASVDVSNSPYLGSKSSLPPPQTTEVPDELRAKIRAMLLATM